MGPRLLTRKRASLIFSKYLLSLSEDDPEEFMHRVVTQDEYWVYHFDPETKKQNVMEVSWLIPSPPPSPCIYIYTVDSLYLEFQGTLLYVIGLLKLEIY